MKNALQHDRSHISRDNDTIKRSAGLIEHLLSHANGKHYFQNVKITIPKGSEDNVRLATRYAQAFSNALSKKQYIVLCAVPVPLAQAITLGAWIAGFPVAYQQVWCRCYSVLS